jgi:hypothetical protein
MIDVFKAFGGMTIGRGNKVFEGKQPHCHFVRHKSHMTLSEIEPGPPRHKAGY